MKAASAESAHHESWPVIEEKEREREREAREKRRDSACDPSVS